MTWSLEEFRELGTNRSLPDTSVYQSTLTLKHWRADNFGGKAVEVWNELFSSHQEIKAGDEHWNTAWLESESYLEAALQALHSMADVLGQIINLAVLGGHFTEAQVTLRGVNREIENRGIAPNIVVAIDQLIGSDEFTYTNGFVNIIKHRRLLDTEFRAEFGRDARNELGLRFKSFTYSRTQFPTMWLSDIVDNIIPGVIDHICTVGNAVNDWLR